MQKIIEDAIAYAAIDAIKEKGMPKTNMLIEDVVSPISYYMFTSDFINKMGLDRFFGAMDNEYKEELKKFVAQGAALYLTRYVTKEPKEFGGIMLKQLLAQAAAMIYRKGFTPAIVA